MGRRQRNAAGNLGSTSGHSTKSLTLICTQSILLVAIANSLCDATIILNLSNQGTFSDPEKDGSFFFLRTSPLDMVSRPGLPTFRAGIVFDFGPLQGPQEIESAELSLYFDDVSGSIEIHGFSGITNAVDVEASNVIAAFRPNQAATYTLDVTNFLRTNAFTDPNFIGFGFRLQNEPLTNSGVRFHTPVLTVVERPVIPEPSTFIVWGLLAITAGFGTWWRRGKV